MTRTGEAGVRDAFRSQQIWCDRLGSPFTARLCGVFAERLDVSTAIGRRLLSWPGPPDARHDAVPLRIAGGLHALVRRGRLPDLAALYPPHELPSADRLWVAVDAALWEAGDVLSVWLDLPPQTNEVARSAVLMAGYATIAAETGLPLSVRELGSSAGLNLLADRYRCRLGGAVFGPASSPVHLQPAWSGRDPPAVQPRMVRRCGIDLNPLDVTRERDRERLAAYVWPDQPERLARVEAAIAIAAADPPAIDRGDAAEWVERQLAADRDPGTVLVFAHSIASQYFPDETQTRIALAIERAGAGADPLAPLAWLRFEVDPAFDSRPSLRLRLWPDGSDRVLALADAHVRAVEWRG